MHSIDRCKVSPGETLARIRREEPLIHQITNVVAANLTANVTLAVGALPVMAMSRLEVIEVSSKSRALVLNMGTPTAESIDSMVLAGKAANKAGVPVVLDPVGAGFTRLRAESLESILEQVSIAVIRANASEVAALCGLAGASRGVAAGSVEVLPADLAVTASRRLNACVAVTGPVDYVTDGTLIAEIQNGHPLMSRITGSGCAATALVAAFASVWPDWLLAAAHALVFCGVAAEKAAALCRGPASFQTNWLDSMYCVSPHEVDELARIEWREVQ